VRPPIVLAPGQVWRAWIGTTRTVLEVNAGTGAANPSVRIQAGARVMTIAQMTMRAWIGRVHAVEDVRDAG
jgi:hypothetical protein